LAKLQIFLEFEFKSELINLPGQILPTVNDWWASGHVGYHVALNKVKIAKVATMLTTSGQSRMASTFR
jgi:hypothetical protein